MIPLMVGFSRLVIHAHSKSEVATGLLLGRSRNCWVVATRP
jgi:membrane-associated phospholipid phosphatase